jgi:hypothetical protein
VSNSTFNAVCYILELDGRSGICGSGFRIHFD